MPIFYTLVDCPLGRLLVATTPTGICAVSLGSQDAGLLDGLRAEYPTAELQPAPPERMQSELQAILACWQGDLAHLDLPLDLRATAFQLRVWEELRRIPYGETRTYSQVAEAIGQPRAVRAVASACASNPVALLNPCHRVIRADGSLGGYRWGLERKQALLSEERARRAQAGLA